MDYKLYKKYDAYKKYEAARTVGQQNNIVVKHIHKTYEERELQPKLYDEIKIESCSGMDIKGLGKIEPYSYFSAISYFKTKTNNIKSVGKYYDNLYEKSQTIRKESLFIENSDKILDTLLLHYLYFHPNTTAMVLWPSSKVILTREHFLYKELENNGIIHGVKKITLTSNQIINFLYQIYYGNSFIKTPKKLKKKQEKIQATNLSNTLYIIFYETTEKISGKNAPFKQKMRQLLQRRVRSGATSNNLLHATDNFMETIELAKLVCNQNSLELLNYQDLEGIMSDRLILSQFMKFKKSIYSEMSLYHQELILFNKGFVSFSLGNTVKQPLILNQYKDIMKESPMIITDDSLPYFGPSNFYYFLGMKFLRIV
jgi:hypothetical protein